MAVTDGNFFLSSSVKDVKSIIDASQKKAPSLANVPEYALAAQGMDELNTPVAVIADESLAYGYPERGPSLKKFLTFGTGYGKDEKGDYIALVLVHDNASQASENFPLLKQRISNSVFPSDNSTSPLGVSWINGKDIISSIEISTDGKVLLAKLYTNDWGLWYKWFSYRGNLLFHEK